MGNREAEKQSADARNVAPGLAEALKRVADEARRLEHNAEFEARVAAHFEADHRTCWETREDGSMGQLRDLERVIALRPYYLDARDNAKRAAAQAADLRALIAALTPADGEAEGSSAKNEATA